jgi:hypothetical protein
MTQIRTTILNALPTDTELQAALFWHLKDQPDEFWQPLAAIADEKTAAFVDECEKLFAALAAAPVDERPGHLAALQNLISATASAGIVSVFVIRHSKTQLKTLLEALASADHKPDAQASTGPK